MTPPITLLSLPDDVLHAILSNLLLSPVAPQLASFLRTTSSDSLSSTESLRISTSFEKAASHPSSNNCPSSIFVSYALRPMRLKVLVERSCRRAFWDFLGLKSPPWPTLQSVELVYVLFYEEIGTCPHWPRLDAKGLAFRTCPLRNLVVHLDALRSKTHPRSTATSSNLPRDPTPIERRVGIEIEMSMRREREERNGTGLNALE
ncbi:hypothetical protein BDY24DRAFT_439985 [Mrakia frigida]|uniref:uncharacterized protein n=1 Tax=Mrakia frigida TaxID=29902 RepID=UPI003FCC1EE4